MEGNSKHLWNSWKLCTVLVQLLSEVYSIRPIKRSFTSLYEKVLSIPQRNSLMV